jgi:Ca2+-binding RTX toxin-like protein
MFNASLKPFVINSTDIDFILAQIKFKPLFDAAGNAILNWDGTGTVYDAVGNPVVGGAVAGDAASLAALASNGPSYQAVTDLSGLRDVTGLNNNLTLIHSAWGAVDQLFPRMAAADYTNYVATLTSNTPGAYGADNVFAAAYGGSYGFNQGGTGPNGTIAGLNTDYTITVGGVQHAIDGTAITIKNVVDYTPRMISLTTTTAGVVYDTWANHQSDPAHVNHTANEIYYGTSGVATVLNWGALQTTALGGEGQVDTQARLAGSAGINDHFVGGLNPGVSPSNGFFALFGQFFDHGLDFIDKGAQGATIKIALAQNDPLYGMAGPDGRPVYEITMNRASVQTVANGSPQYVDHTSPFIDQSQTYGSHEQLTTLLRNWVMDPVTGKYHAGMEMFDGHTLTTTWTKADGTVTNATLPTLNELAQAVVDTGRDALTWEDVLNLRNRDVTTGKLTTGNSDSSLLLDMNPRFDTTNLHQGNATQDAAVDAAITTLKNDLKAVFGSGVSIGFNANGVLAITGMPLPPGSPALVGANALYPWVNFSNFSIMQTNAIMHSAAISSSVHDAVSTILMASVGDHYIAGDGRVNENFGLTSIHHIFHEEHNFQVGNFMDALHREAISTGSFDNLHSFQVDMSAKGGSINAVTGDYLTSSGAIAWDLDKMFNATKLIVEMEYQHAAVDQYARNVSPNIQEFVGYSPDKNPSVTLEYAQAAFRFGHSQLRETIDTIDPTHGLTGKIMGYALRDAFLNPDQYAAVGPAAILLGMTHQQMNEIDEFITPALNQGLLGQPLDLAAINIARGRDIGIPTLNDFRGAIGLAKYTSWNDFGHNMQHPSSLVNFIAAYSFDGDMAKAQEILDLVSGTVTTGTLTGATQAQAFAFLEGDAVHAGANLAAGALAFNQIDTWLGGLAEVHQPGGILGETFDKVFVNQIESLMDGDRFYYLYRLAGQQFAGEIGGGQLKDIVERNTGLTHLNGNIFGYADQYVDLGATRDKTALTLAAGGTQSTLTHTYGQATSLSDTHTLDSTGTMLAINSGDTVGNEHKYGDNVAVASGAMGVYSNGGVSNVMDGTIVTIGGVNYIRDTRLADSNPNSLYAANSGVNLDGTPNSGAESNEVIVGTKGNDMIYAQGGDDTVYGEGGNDIIYGGYGIDRLYGGAGSDTIYGGDNPDLIDGGAGDDRLFGESSGSDINGMDQIEGGSGNDYIDGGTGIDKLNGGSGDDHILGGQDTDPFTHGGDGNDLIEGNSGGDILYGDNGDDVLVGGADQDQMFGGNGDDIIRPGDPTGAMTIGSDEVLGGDGVSDVNPDGTIGFDIIDYSDNSPRTNGVSFDLSAQLNPALAVNGSPTQTPSSQIEGVIGSVSGDTLTSGSTHVGSAGNTVLDDNWVIGGSGNDLLVNSAGGSGNDVFIGGSMRLDALIGKYASGNYTNNNDNLGLTAADQLLDARYQGASHRVLWSEQLDNSGFLTKVNATLGGANYASHFTEMLRSEQFKDMVLGDGGAKGNDTVVFNGKLADYTLVALDVNGHHTTDLASIYAVRVTDHGAAGRVGTDGSDLVIGVDNFKFADGTRTLTSLYGCLYGSAPVIDLSQTFVDNTYIENFATQTLNGTDATGTLAWNTNWVETNDGTNTAATGQIRMVRTNGGVLANGGVLEFRDSPVGATLATGPTITRAVDLSGATSGTATLSFNYVENGFDAPRGTNPGETVTVQFSRDGSAANFVTVDVINNASGTGVANLNLTGPFTSDAALRFILSGVSTGTGDTVRIDNVTVAYQTVLNDGSLNNAVTYVEPGTSPNGTAGAVAIAKNPGITSNIITNMASAKVDITNAKAGDALRLSGTLPTGITAATDTSVAGHVTLNLTGTASLADYQKAIALVQFYSTSDNPDTTVRNIDVSVSDGTLTSNVAHTTVTVVATNDAPTANTESVITTSALFTAGFSVPDWAFLANDTDPDSSLTVASTTNASGLSAVHSASQITITNATGTNDRFQYRATDGSLTSTSSNINVTTVAGTSFSGGNGSQILVGGAAAETFNGGAGNDVILAGGGDDTITQTSTDGRDIVDGGANTPGGGAGTGDTYVLNGVVGAETFTIYAITAGQNAGLAASLGTTFQANTEIVITRTVGLVTTVVAELDNIEEIRINSLNTTANNGNNAVAPDGGLNGGDTIAVVGNFTSTSLNYSTITVNGAASDTVNITDLTSAHRIVFNTADGTGTVIGDLRPQDVINSVLSSVVDVPTLSIGDFSSSLVLMDSNDSLSFLPSQQFDNVMSIDQFSLISGAAPTSTPTLDYGSMFDQLSMDQMQGIYGMEDHFHQHAMRDYFHALV